MYFPQRERGPVADVAGSGCCSARGKGGALYVMRGNWGVIAHETSGDFSWTERGSASYGERMGRSIVCGGGAALCLT